MNLRTKLLSGIGIALVVTFALVAIFSYLSMTESYGQLERSGVTQSVERAVSSLTTDQEILLSVTRDYAVWTETYDFIRGENPAWIAENTGDDFFLRFGIDGILVTNRSGSVIFEKGFNDTILQAQALPPSLKTEVRIIGGSEEQRASREGAYLIVESPGAPLVIASHPVLMDNLSGESVGMLHVVRRIDASYLAEISDRTGRNVRIISADEAAGNRTLSPLLAGISPGHPVVLAADTDDRISGYTRLDHLRDPAMYYLQVTGPREITRAGQQAIARFLVTLSAAGIFIILFVLLFIDRVVLSRLNTLIRTVREGRGVMKNDGPHPEEQGDELARLAKEIDPVFDRLAESTRELQQSEERYRTLAESARDFIYIVDTEDRIRYVNIFAANALGLSKDAIIGKPRASFFPAPERDRQHQSIQKVILTGKPLNIENTLTLPDGEIWQDTLLVPLRDRHDVITGVMGITRDITQRKKIEIALSQANKKLSLLSTVTRHDILNQLTALRTYLELSDELAVDPEVADIVRKEKNIAEIIDRQLAFYRDYQQMGVKAPQWQNVRKIITWSIQPLATPMVKIVVDCPDLQVYADPLLERVFFNIIDNSIKYGGPRLTRVRISAQEAGERGLVISFEDDGIGIPGSDKERIFEQGFGQHTGLGLFFSREILGITAITITETGTYGNGARFEIAIPRGTYRFPEPGKIA